MAKSYLQLNDTIATFVDEHNSLVNKVGDLANLATTGDSDLIQAINEIHNVADSAQSRIDGLITERTAFPSNFIPDADGTRNLGADATRWNSTYHDYARVTNNIHVGNGSAATPAYAFEGDTNTGLYRSAADELSISTGGVERMRIDSSGNVGIGTSSPRSGLDVGGNNITINALRGINVTRDSDEDTVADFINFPDVSTAAAIARIFRNTNTTGIKRVDFLRGNGASTPIDVRIGVDGQNSFFNSGGNVGIGTSSPSYELDVVGVSDASIRVRATGDASSDDSLLRMSVSNADASNYILFGDNSDADAGYIRYQHNNDSLQIVVNAAERMRIDSSGNVGIGTSSPSEILHIRADAPNIWVNAIGAGEPSFNGGRSSNGGLLLTARAMNTSSKYTPAIMFGSTDTDFVTNTPRIGAAIVAEASETFSSDTTGNMHLSFWTRDGSTTDQNAAERMRITSDGNVGIGTSSPATLLHVAANNNGLTSTTANNTIRLEDRDTTSATDQPIGKIEFYSNDTNAPAGVKAYVLASSTGVQPGSYLAFAVSDTASDAAEVMRINTSNVSVASNFIPDADGTRNLGADATRWNSTYHDYARVTNNIHVGNGSAATPAYAFEGDTNTGLYKDSDDIIKASGGGSPQFDLAGVRGASGSGSATSITAIQPSTQSINSLTFKARSKTALIHGAVTFYSASDATYVYASVGFSGGQVSQTQIGALGALPVAGADSLSPSITVTNLTPGVDYTVQLFVAKSAAVTLLAIGSISVIT